MEIHSNSPKLYYGFNSDPNSDPKYKDCMQTERSQQAEV